MDKLPYSKCTIVTHADCEYEGVKYIKGVCGVSIMRSGNYNSHLNLLLIRHMDPFNFAIDKVRLWRKVCVNVVEAFASVKF